MRTLLLAAVAATVLSLPAAPASADDPPRLTTNCIDYREFKTMETGTKPEVEAEVDATGRVVATQHHGRRAVYQYKWCGHYASEGFFQIAYSGRSGHRVATFVSLFDLTDNDPLSHQPT